MSFQALNSALSGLRVAQQQLTVISNNVSNATTAGYTRKLLPQSTQVIDSTGQIVGVRGETMIRSVDLNLERELWTQVSSVAETDIKAAYLDTIEKFHGATNKESSIAAQIAALKDKFSALSDSPADGFLLSAALGQAKTVANKFNEFGELITQLRNDAQDEMATTVDRINALVSSIADLNKKIKGSANVGRSTAGLEDQRDESIKELSGLMNITFFRRGDNVLVIQSTGGAQLCDENPTQVYFNPADLGASTTYPSSAAGVYVGGDPTTNRTAVDITTQNVGGKLGGLIDMRDNTLMRYQAQVDELAHKTALRFEAQGLRLFTDPSGAVPLDTPPDLTTNPPGAVSYIGFASTIRVNQAIIDDVSLLQKGTYNTDKAIPGASNEVIRRVIQFAFGTVNYQEAAGTTDLNIAAPATDLQSWLGLHSSNNVVGGINLSNFTEIDDGTPSTTDLMDTLAAFMPGYPANDQFQITFNDPRLGIPAETITIDLSDIATNPLYAIGTPGINNALDQIIAGVNAQMATVDPAFAAVATRNSSGQLSIQSTANVTLDASSFAGAMGSAAFGALGFQERTYATEDPYFDVQVGSNDLVRITIEPGDTPADLVNKLQYNPATGKGVPGLYVDFDAVTGQLTIRPGMDDTNGGPRFGGDIRILSGPAKTTGAVNPALAGLPQSVSAAAAIFGSYVVNGGTVTERSPVEDVKYMSETSVGSGVYVPFRLNNLGPAANLGTNILTGQAIIDFGQKMVNSQAQDVILNKTQGSDQTTLRDLLQERFLNETGVNIDEELSMLIVIQTAYSAAARAVSAADEMFQELLNAFR